MPIDKSGFNLKKSQEKYKGFLKKKAVQDVNAQVIAALDISGSMKNYYPKEMQNVVNYLAAVAFSLDDNSELDTYLFSDNSEKITNVTKDNLDNFINKEVTNKSKTFYWNGTNYAPFMQKIVDDFFSKETIVNEKSFFGFVKKQKIEKTYLKNSKDDYPVYVIILTDGMCFDKIESENIINQFKDSNIYWQFIGITKNKSELSLIEHWGDKYPNVGYFNFNDLYSMDEDKLFEELVSSEFVNFITKAN